MHLNFSSLLLHYVKQQSATTTHHVTSHECVTKVHNVQQRRQILGFINEIKKKDEKE